MHEHHNKLNYVELCARDIEATKAFFTAVFAWDFTDYGPDYTCFTGQGLDGGFYRSEQTSVSANGGALLVLYSSDIEITQRAVEKHGGVVNKAVFSFPGGRRFHFIEPSGNEFAVWTDK
ncbi:VOC family protein [Pseudoalteromonas sp. SSDWG2]|uniref:VOC family protein n=1 Tax=Pseudoalteromonas sp. SSDWG2 TaxID=3139391 RepID=UPI003BAA9C6F